MLTIAWCQAVLVKNLLEHLIYKRHTGIYKKLCFRLRSPNRHCRGCKKEQLCTSPETPVTGMDWVVFCAILVSTTVCRTVAIRRSVSLSPLSQVPGTPGASSERSPLSTAVTGSCLLLLSFLLLSQGQSVFQCLPYTKHAVPSPMVAHLSSGYSCSGNPLLPPGNVAFSLASSCFFCCSLLLNTFKATSASWEGVIPSGPSNFCDFLMSGELCPIRVMFTILIIFRGLRVCIRAVPISMINSF